MDTIKNKPAQAKDDNLVRVFRNYQLLKTEVEQWQQERGSYWSATMSLAKAPPYMPIFDLPSEAIIELWQKLNSSVKAEISASDLRVIWDRLRAGQYEIDQEMSTRLQMAISGVAQLACQLAKEMGLPEESYGLGEANESSSYTVCPVCGEASELAILTPPVGKRKVHCTSCGCTWPVKRIACLHCGSEEAKQLVYLQNEGYPGVEMAVCQVCGKYIKEIDVRQLSVQDYIWEEIRTLPLNFAAENWLLEQKAKNNLIN